MDLPIDRVLRPPSLAAALAALAEHPGARPIAGGTDLVVQLRAGRRRAATVVDLGAAGLDGIREVDGGLEIGATTSMAAIAAHPLVRARHPALAAAAARVGAWPIQCRATIGGNLANASPAADTAPALLVSDAELVLASRSGIRRAALAEFFTGPGGTVLGPGELISAVRLPAPPAGAFERFDKLGPRSEQVIAVVSLASRVVVAGGRLARVRLALGAVAPTPLRARRAEAALEGRRLDADTSRGAIEALEAEIAPIDDVRAPARYRRLAAAVLLARLLAACHG